MKTPALNKIKSKLIKMKKSGAEYVFVKKHFISYKDWDIESAEIQTIDTILRCVEIMLEYFKSKLDVGIAVGNNDYVYVTDSNMFDITIEPLNSEQYKHFDSLFGDSGQIGFCSLTDIALLIGVHQQPTP